MEHLVVNYLRNNTVLSLESFGIFAKPSKVNPRKFSLNYDQIEAVNGNPLVDLCRGLILEAAPETELGEPGVYNILAYPFDRFYNLGSEHAAQIDWDSAWFEEKLDGTLCILYYDFTLDKWCVATRNVPDADVPNNQGDTFASLFWRHLSFTTAFLQIGATYMFELTGPDNQIVVTYDDWNVTLLASRNSNGVLTSGDAYTYSFKNMSEAREWLAQQPGHKSEGFVVVDKNGNRIKIKGANYLAVSRVMTSAGSDVGLVEIVLSGTADDVRSILPLPRQNKLDMYSKKVVDLAHLIETTSRHLKETCHDRKSYALAIQADPAASPWMSALMAFWLNQVNTFSGYLDSQKRNGEIPRSFAEKVLLWINSNS